MFPTLETLLTEPWGDSWELSNVAIRRAFVQNHSFCLISAAAKYMIRGQKVSLRTFVVELRDRAPNVYKVLGTIPSPKKKHQCVFFLPF
jgi:hypothetical protein